MNDKRQPNQSDHAEGFNIGDIYFVLFRQKWIILAFCILGLMAAGVISVFNPPQYESEAKMYIQYLKGVDAKPGGPSDGTINVSAGSASDQVQNELEILTSLDVATEVVANVGADRILSKLGGGEDTNVAAGVVMGNLIKDDVPKTLSILRIAYQNPDKDVARDVLRSIVEVYLKRSDATHSVEMPQDLLTNAVEQLRGEVQDTETRLNKAKQDAGVISSLEETKKNLSDRYEQLSRDLGKAQVELSSVDVAPTNSPAATAPTNTTQEIPVDVLTEYQSTLGALGKAMADLAKAKGEYPEGSSLLEVPRQLVHDLRNSLHEIEVKYPQIGSSPGTVASVNPQPFDGMVQALNAHQLRGEIGTYKDQMEQIKAYQNQVDAKSSEISLLQHTLDSKSTMLKAYMDRMVLASDKGRREFSGGIKIAENPTPAVRKRSKAAKKKMAMALAGGVGGGLALAFLIEMVLDRSIKRPSEIEAKLKLPLFISIPDFNGNSYARSPIYEEKNHLLLNGNNTTALTAPNGEANGHESEEIPAWDSRHSLHKFYSGLRDRLIVNFEVRNLNHNPKLVGVTSCNRGAGVSTVAAGLAASLSETGDGNVLLVDMRGKEGTSRQFYKGKPACGLDAALGIETRNDAHVHDNLYAASGGGADGDMPSTLSKRFATLMPKLKASDYDYIIFDMPPVSQTSMTARLSGLMDMVMLVIESEKTNRDSVKRATALLKESKAHVSTVLNKVHTYVPGRLHQEFLDDED